jgi:predicted Zn-dependent protease
MQEIAQDPEGAKLAQAAQAQGLTLQVGQLPPGVMGETLNGTITISTQAMSNKPDLIHTLAHELGHAATPNDGDSLNEEQTVDQLGQRIQQRIAPGPTFQLDIGGYRGLPQDNGIRNSLAQIGL